MKKKIITPEKAFVRSGAGYEFPPGTKLPFRFQSLRQSASALMGLRFGLVDESDIFSITVETLQKGKKQKHDLQFYNQLFSDVVTVIWLCTVPDSRVLRAMRKADEAKSDAFAWADGQSITLISQRYYEAAGAFFQIMQDITVSTAVPIPRDNEPTEDEDDPNE